MAKEQVVAWLDVTARLPALPAESLFGAICSVAATRVQSRVQRNPSGDGIAAQIGGKEGLKAMAKEQVVAWLDVTARLPALPAESP